MDTGAADERGPAKGLVTADNHPELWAFLSEFRQGDLLSGTIAAIESFGVFVALDDGPAHPLFPGVGFITYPELAWHSFDQPTDVVRPGERISAEFLQFDTWNGEARLSLRATRPNPYRAHAELLTPGSTLTGRVTRLLPFGAVVEVAERVDGLVHVSELADPEPATPEEAVRVGDEVRVTVLALDPDFPRLLLSRRRASR